MVYKSFWLVLRQRNRRKFWKITTQTNPYMSRDLPLSGSVDFKGISSPLELMLNLMRRMEKVRLQSWRINSWDILQTCMSITFFGCINTNQIAGTKQIDMKKRKWNILSLIPIYFGSNYHNCKHFQKIWRPRLLFWHHNLTSPEF